MDIKLPKVGESITEAIINKWMKSIGDRVKKYEPLAEIVTDKVTMEFPSPVNGIITEIYFSEGSTVKIETPIMQIQTDEIPAEDTASSINEANLKKLRHIGEFSKEVAPVGPTGSANVAQNDPAVKESRQPKQKYSPIVTKLAKQHNIDLSSLSGSGQNGRITKNDIEKEIASSAKQFNDSSENHVNGKLVKLTPIRKKIADNMLKSSIEIPEAWTLIEVDVSQLVELKTNADSISYTKLTYMPFIMSAIVKSIKKNPIINSQWTNEGILLKDEINLGFAVATDLGLHVPVIKSADQLNVIELGKLVTNLTSKARNNQLSLSDVTNGTFTINNTGALGSIIGKAIIYPGQAAIINTESIQKRPVIIDDKIHIRSMMNLCLTFDHRIMDGAEASKFMTDVKLELQKIHHDFVK
ncbi:MAG: 2-oxo acid dehydrogenase subunit E2 [SAR202 cluster bacterium]|nr:2-oxo acid dehydrogenase subunit E2 [SAR202 cluster bacterium]|tara:strand:+ start:7404 stop:8639 length:1236 start_codon:yes stop_codon:yes gene_type:complete